VVGEKEHFSWKKKRVSLVEKNVWITERFFDNHYRLKINYNNNNQDKNEHLSQLVLSQPTLVVFHDRHLHQRGWRSGGY
jgi:hypothetical protein